MLGFFPVGAKPLAALPTGPWYVWGEVGDLACVHEEVRLLYVPFENRLAVVPFEDREYELSEGGNAGAAEPRKRIC